MAKNFIGTWQMFGHWLVKASRPQTSSAFNPGLRSAVKWTWTSCISLRGRLNKK